jgi:hypothetical protein
MKNLLIILIIFIVLPTAASQTLTGDSSANYFPLSIGNSWTYTSPWDTNYKRTSIISDTTRIDGSLYYIKHFANPSYADTLRMDSIGNIWKYYENAEHLWFDFSRDSGSIYIAEIFRDDTMFVHVTKNVEVTVYAGHFINCIKLFFDVPGWIDEEVEYTFAPGVGIIHEVGGWTDEELFTATIDGQVITTTSEPKRLPTTYALYQNYPNPFNPSTSIDYEIPERSHVNVKIYDILGQEMATILNETKEAGKYNIRFNATGLPGGVYFYMIRAGDFISTRKLVLLK